MRNRTVLSVVGRGHLKAQVWREVREELNERMRLIKTYLVSGSSPHSKDMVSMTEFARVHQSWAILELLGPLEVLIEQLRG